MILSYAIDDVPESVLRFWHETRAAQDPVGLMSSSIEWLDLLTSHDTTTAAVLAVDGSVVLPLMRRPYAIDVRLMGRCVQRRAFDVLKVCGGELISKNGDVDALAAVWDAAMDKHPSVDAIWFDHVCASGQLALIEQSVARSAQCRLHVLERDLPHCRMVMPPDYEACLAQRSSKSLARLRSKTRALERDIGSSCAVLEFRTAEEWAPYAEKIDALMEQSWQVRMLGHAFALEHHRTAASRGMVRAFLLTCGENAVAFTLYYSGRETLIAGFLGYDQRFARHSPGAILFLKTLACLYAQDPPRYLDFGEGDADYKAQWSNDTVHVHSLMVLRKSARLERTFARASRCASVTRALRRALQRVGLERALVQRLKRSGNVSA
jgi:CelD/BcsL family acetyltransferase involved in cellulose biosynthesis